jgi:sigma-E factor negative regulatory protein RseC
MKQTGTVQSVRGPYVDVLVKRPDACHGCGACKLANDEPRIVAARNDVGALAGDTVEIELSGDILMRAVGLAYGVPLVMFMLGLLLGEPIARRIGLAVNPSLASAITAFIFLAAGYYLIHHYDRSLGVGAFMSVATEIIDSAHVECAPKGCIAAERFGESEENQ